MGRAVIVVGSCAITILLAGLLLAVVIWLWMLAGSGFARVDFNLLRYLAIFAVPLTAALATAPTALGVAYGEWAGKRTHSYYAAAGALSGLVALAAHIGLAMWRNASARRLVTDAGTLEGALKLGAVILMCAAIGVLAAMIYWLLAGRRSGMARG